MYTVEKSRTELPDSSGEAQREARDTPGADPIESEVVQLYTEHAAAMLRYAAVFTDSHEAAQDAVQETFLRYVMFRGGGEDVHSPKAWLMRVMRNYLLDLARRSKSRVHVGIEEAHQQAAHSRQDAPDGAAGELAEMLASLLSPRELECVRLRSEGFCYQDIAEILDIRSGTVGAVLARAHSKLRKALSAAEKNRRRRLQQPKEVPYAP